VKLVEYLTGKVDYLTRERDFYYEIGAFSRITTPGYLEMVASEGVSL